MSEEAKWEQLASLSELGLLSASLLHEVRQPLFALKSLADLLRASERLTGDELRSLDEVVAHLEGLVAGVQGWGANGDAQLVDLTEEREGALRLLGASATRVEVVGDGPIWVQARPVGVRQVAVNLLLNALDAAGPRGQVRVSCGFEAGRARLAVHDSGDGVPPELQQQLLEPFYTTKEKGTGLGLFLVRQVLERDGGELFVGSSDELGGAQFVASWPAVTG